ncbi:MAG: bifunctional (p)ppGpp synthetase/guanosine-3',5'-bis(diphosphate) 3'-pyrophosphohydrolase [Desulfotalea sp.]
MSPINSKYPAEIKNILHSYMPEADYGRLEEVWAFAAEVHEGRKHFSGQSYLQHTKEVALTLASMKLDYDTILAGILHGAIKAGVEEKELRKRFGDDVADIVTGATRITNVQFHNDIDEQAEGLRKMLLAMASDVRVLLVQLVDRLNDMFFLDHRSEERQLEIAHETMTIYAPLASRLGIDWLKRELEDQSFKYLHPYEYKELNDEMESSLEEREAYVAEMLDILKTRLKENDIEPLRVLGRPKHLYSIYKKLVAQNISLDKVYDKVAFRIIVETVKDCYESLGVIHGEWIPVPGRIKDFISVPKANNYQSMHTTVAGPHKQFVEIQIRTEEMDRIASDGVAAHWAYKEGQKTAGSDAKLFSDLKNMVKSLKDVEDPREFLDSFKGELYEPDIYVLTPNGQVKEFPARSCPIDFAYAVHTEVGNKCTGAKVNGRLVPLKYQMQNGDIVEIITSTSQHPRNGWLDLVQTGRAKARIRAWFRIEENEKFFKIGREICEKEMRGQDTGLKRLIKSGEIKPILKKLRCNGPDDLYIKVGSGAITVEYLKKALPSSNLDLENEEPAYIELSTGQTESVKFARRAKNSLSIAGIDGMLVKISQCCRPVPGDKITGFITQGRGVTVHKSSCANLLASDPNRRIEVSWSETSTTTYRGVLCAITENTKGIFSEVSAVVGGEDIVVVELNARMKPDDTAEFTIAMEVKNTEQLQHVMLRLKQMPEVISVRRV